MTTLLGVLLICSGCQHQQLADKQAKMRVNNLENTCDMACKSERGRTQKLECTLRHVAKDINRDAADSRKNIDDFERYWLSDWNRWLERDGQYGPEAWKMIRGKPDRIEPNAIILFF